MKEFQLILASLTLNFLYGKDGMMGEELLIVPKQTEGTGNLATTTTSDKNGYNSMTHFTIHTLSFSFLLFSLC